MYSMLFVAILVMLVWSVYGYLRVDTKVLARMYLGGIGVCSAMLFLLLFRSAGML